MPIKSRWERKNRPWLTTAAFQIIGKAIKVGSNVKDVKVGDRVGVGAQVYSCGKCKQCKNGNENYCSGES